MNLRISRKKAFSLTIREKIGKIEEVIYHRKRDVNMKRIKTIETRNLEKSVKNGGCGECQTSCQSACKTSCGVANQACEKANN